MESIGSYFIPKGAFIQSVLTDEEVWEFLTQDSAALIEQGVSIHLPSWWESLKSHHKSIWRYRKYFICIVW